MKRYGIAAGVGLWLVALYAAHSTAWPRPYDDTKNAVLYLGAGVVVLCYLACRRAAVSLRLTAVHLVVLLYCLVALLSFFPSTTPFESALALARLLLWGGLAMVFARMHPGTVRLVCLASVLAAAVIVWNNLFGWQEWEYFKYGMHPIGHISYYGDFVALQIPLVAYLMATSRRVAWRMVLCPLLPFFFIGLWFVGTRASIVGLFASGGMVGLLWLVVRRRAWWWVPIGMIAAGVVVWGADHYKPGRTDFRADSTMQRLLQIPADLQNVAHGRMRGYRTTLRMIADRPWLGWGLGTFRFVYPEYAHDEGPDSLAMHNTWFMHPHNELLHQAMELGIPALLLWIGAIAALFWKTGAALRTLCPSSGGRPCEQAPEIWLGIAGVTLCLVSWQFSTNFLFPVSRFLAALYAGVLWREVAPHFAVYRTIRFPRWAAGLSLVLAAGLVTGEAASLYAVQQIRSDPARQVLWARRAWWLAPGAFNSAFAHAVTAGREADGPGGLLIDSLHRHFPYVPIVLFYKAQRELTAGNMPAAREHLQHVLANDPGFTAARYMLESLE